MTVLRRYGRLALVRVFQDQLRHQVGQRALHLCRQLRPSRRSDDAAGLAACEQIHLRRLAPLVLAAGAPLSWSCLTWASPRFGSQEVMIAPESNAFDDAVRAFNTSIRRPANTDSADEST